MAKATAEKRPKQQVERTEQDRERLMRDLRTVDRRWARENGRTEGTISYKTYRSVSKCGEQFLRYWSTWTAFRQEVFGQDFHWNAISPVVRVGEQRRRYFVTAAVGGQPLDPADWATVQGYSKRTNAEIVILPMRGAFRSDDSYPEELRQYADLFCTEYRFNSNLAAQDYKLYPRDDNPERALALRYAHVGHSILAAHPKQNYCTTPVRPGKKYPRLVALTGAVTRPERYGNVMKSALARHHHVMGGLIVEVVDRTHYHLRQAQIIDGAMLDLGYLYRGDRREKAQECYLKIGDPHAGSEDEEAVAGTIRMINELGATHAIGGDWFDCYSVSYHNRGDMRAIADRPQELGTLEGELHVFAKLLERFCRECPKTTFVIDPSNHHEQLYNYLRFNEWHKDELNYQTAMGLADAYIRRRLDPLAWWLFEHYPKLQGRVRFLDYRESLMFGGFEMGKHGHRAADGVRRSVTAANLRKAFGPCVCGHTHAPSEDRGVIRAGTLARRDMAYMRDDPSSWMPTNIAVWASGHHTALHIIEQDYRMRE